jgi:Putative beta barrel porin-7 (BBP7)
VNRLPRWSFLAACWLGELLLAGSLWGFTGDLLTPDDALAAPSAAESTTEMPFDDGSLWGPGIWGRTNPDFAGFPTFSFAADLVVLQRSAPDAQTILFDGSFNPLLNATDLDASTRAGGKFNFMFQDPNGWDVYFEMLLMDDFRSRQSVDTSGGVTLIFYQGLALAPVDTVRFRSDLDTGELMLRRRLNPHLALLGGIRYLELQEDLDITRVGTTNTGYFSQSDNRLWGGQVGVEGVIPANGYVRLFATGKYGIYNNRYQIAAQATNTSGAPLEIVVRDSMAAYVGELNVGLEVQTVPCCTIRIGYQALWLTNVAQSVDQLNQFDIFSGTGTVRKGSPVYHGGFAGLVFTF